MKINFAGIIVSLKKVPKKTWIIVLILYVLLFSIGFLLLLTRTEAATDVSGNISVDTTWDIAGSPYNMTNNVTVLAGVTLTIDPGVTVNSNGNYTLIVLGTLDVNGVSGSEVTFKHTTATSRSSWRGIRIDSGGVATIDYADIRYASVGAYAKGGTLTIQDSTVDMNETGVSVDAQGSLVTARNTITRCTVPLNINPDTISATLGTGGDADILGTDGNKNEFNAIGIGNGNRVTNDCPSNICTISQREFAGISNIPYIIYASGSNDRWEFSGSDDTLVVDAGVIIKIHRYAYWGVRIDILNGATLEVNGTVAEPVYFTSWKDDSIGGDTNNDGSATSPAIDDWGQLRLWSVSTHTINNAVFSYAGGVISVTQDGTALEIYDTVIKHNILGIALQNYVSLTTARNEFKNNREFPIVMMPDADVLSFGSGADADILGSGLEKNKYNAIGLAWEDLNLITSCPLGVCTLRSYDFAGISNIPYVTYSTLVVRGAANTLVVDSSVIVKALARGYFGNGISIEQGATMEINGTLGNEVYFTSVTDDSIGGDTGNDGPTSGVHSYWSGININASTLVADHAVVSFAQYGFRSSGLGAIATVRDSLLHTNATGIEVFNQGPIVTERNTFNSNVHAPITLNPDITSAVLGSGADVDTLGTGPDRNGFNAIGLWHFSTTTNSCPPAGCSIPTREFAGIPNIPYIVVSSAVFEGSGNVLDLTDDVIIKFRANTTLTVRSSASIDRDVLPASGTLYITSYRDDSIGGDTNNDGVTSGSVADWGGISLQSGTSIVKEAEFHYGNVPLYVLNLGSSLTIDTCKFENNRVGVAAYERASITTANNTFNSNTHAGIQVNPDVTSATLGTGGDADILGSGANANGYNAIAIGYYDDNPSNCPSGVCSIPQREFADLPNIPYIFINTYYIQKAGDVLDIDGGVVLKLVTGKWLYATGTTQINVNGSVGNEVSFTSYRDDSIGGDTNNDGPSSGAYGDWGSLNFRGGATGVISNAVVSYGTIGVNVYDLGSSATISDCLFDRNNVGITVRHQASIETARNKFYRSQFFPIEIPPNVTSASLGSGDDSDILGTGADKNGYDAIGFGYGSSVSGTCPTGGCVLSQITFAGRSDIPYVRYGNYTVGGAGNVLIIDPGIVIKAISGSLIVNNNAQTQVNGTYGNPVYMTSDKDDLIAGDTNNDGYTTYPHRNDWYTFELTGVGPHEVNFLYARYANRAFRIVGTNITISDSYVLETVDSGVRLETSASPTFTRMNIENHSNWGMWTSNATPIYANNLWWGVANGPLDTSDAGSCLANAGDGSPVYDTTNRPIEWCNTHSTVKFNTAVVDTQAPSDVYGTSATANGSVEALDGFFDIVQHGHVWSTISTPVYVQPVGHWKMNDNADNQIVGDALGTYNGTYFGSGGSNNYTSSHSVPGKVNTALEFDGTNGYIELPSSAFTSFREGFSVAFWVNPTAVKNNARFFDFGNGATSNNIMLYRSGTETNLIFAVYTGTSASTLTATSAISPNEWQHFAVTVDVLGNTVIYKNGSAVASGKTIIPREITRVGNYIAKSNNTGVVNFQGYMDDFRIFKSAISPDQIATLYNESNGSELSISDGQSELGPTSSTGNYDSPMTGLTSQTTYYTRSYVQTLDGNVYYGPSEEFVTNSMATAYASDLSGHGHIYAGKSQTITAVYSDGDGADNLDKLYLKLQNPDGTDIEYYADEGPDQTGLSPTAISGSGYVSSINYDRDTGTPTANDLTITWNITYNWQWDPSNNIKFGVKAYDDMGYESEYDYTEDNYTYYNSLDFTGTLTATGATQGALSSGDWVAGNEDITWSGLTVVYEGTLSQHPHNSDFNVRVCNDDSDCSTDYSSSGIPFNTTLTANATTDTEDLHSIEIVDVPSGGASTPPQTFTVRVDASSADIIAITGDNNDIWQNINSGPEIFWTNPLSPSGDTYYITNDSSEPTESNHTYTTGTASYDLPDQGEGTTTIKARAVNNVQTKGPVYTFTIKYDNSPPTIDSVTSVSNPVETNWYPSATPDIVWTSTDTVSGIEGVWRLIDQTAVRTTEYIITNGTQDVEDGSYTSGTIAPGTWYYHLAARDLIGHTDTAHFQINTDSVTPNIVGVTGDYNNVWQNVEPGPVISWTDPNSISGDTFYISNDGTTPSNSNFEYYSIVPTYDLPDQEQGETIIKVVARNGAGTYSAARSFVVRYDTVPPASISDLTLTVLSTSSIQLKWTNPPDPDLDRVVVVRNQTTTPSTPNDGTIIYSGLGETFTDTGLSHSVRYYYAAFAYDWAGNESSGILGSATTKTPVTPPVIRPPVIPPIVVPPVDDNELPDELNDLADEVEEIESVIEVIVKNSKHTTSPGGQVQIYSNSVVEIRVSAEPFIKARESELVNVFMILENGVYLMTHDTENGRFSAKVQGPKVKAVYQVRFLANYADGGAVTSSFNLEVDPFGYIYTMKRGNQLRINDAAVTLYQKIGGKEILWGETSASDNPQVTDETGEYSFIVSPGTYKLKATAEGYAENETDWFIVDKTIVNINIELKPIPKLADPWWGPMLSVLSIFLPIAVVFKSTGITGAVALLAQVSEFWRSLLGIPFAIAKMFKKKRKKWNTVYDSSTKSPLAFAVIRLINKLEKVRPLPRPKGRGFGQRPAYLTLVS